jgi:4-hydroxy-tetrahydrodipicolinate synthase
LDEEGVRKQTRFLIDSGIKNGSGVLVPTGSTGECPMLTDEERKKVIQLVKEEAKDDVPVVAGCNHTSTQTVIKLVHYAEEVEADGVMISPPYYWMPSEEIVLNHYKNIAKETKLGIMVYNNFFASQMDIPVETMVKLAEIPNIVALKECTPIIPKFIRMMTALGDKISIVNGSGTAHEPACSSVGARGFVSGEANFIPKTSVEIYQAMEQGDYAKALKLCRKIAPLVDFILGGESSADYIGRTKAAMNMIGIPAGPPRSPLLPADKETKNQLRKLLKEVELFDKFEIV